MNPHSIMLNGRVYYGDNLPILRDMESASVPLIYVDPPFNTGKIQARTRIRTVRSEQGDRVGFKGQRYQTVTLGRREYPDVFDDYLAFVGPRLIEAQRILAPNGTLYVHLDAREVHYCKVLLDSVFGRGCFLNEIIWAYDYGGRTKRRWPPKHDNILVYVKNPMNYVFNAHDIDRLPYMAPGLVGKEKANQGKLPTDTWWHTIVATNGKERTGYPTQKPLAILERIIRASSNPGDTVLDFFAGSGTTGEAAYRLGRRFVLVDNNQEALRIMAARFAQFEGVEFVGFEAAPFQSGGCQGRLFALDTPGAEDRRE